jgi:hypothetical protein
MDRRAVQRHASTAVWPAWVQRRGIGPSCDCGPEQQRVGIQRRIEHATANGGAESRPDDRLIAHELTHVLRRDGLADAATEGSADAEAGRWHHGAATNQRYPDLPAVQRHSSAAVWPAWVQGCGVGSSCDCGPGQQGAGIQRDIQHATAGGGSPLHDGPLSSMEAAFSVDFSSVRVHTGPAADDVAGKVNAHALTAGTQILFRSGAYNPGTESGDRLIAHELAHVVQQRDGVARAAIDGGPSDPLERAADAAADKAVTAVRSTRARAETSVGHVDGAGGSARTPRDGPPRRGADDGVQRQAKAAPVLIPHAGSVIQRQVAGARPRTAPAHPQRLELEVVGSDARLDEPLAVMADRWAHDHGGRVLRVSSLEDMISQIEALLNPATCLGRLVVWYHGSPEIQLIVGEYPLPPKNLRLPASGFTREWLQLERNHAALTRFRHLFCCDALMHWIGCGTVIVRAGGGLRTPAELEREPAQFREYPDVYQSAEEARRHGAKLAGASFGKINAQAWANAACVTIRGATDFVTLRPESRTPITIDNRGHWVDVRPQAECPCDPETGRVAGEAPSRAEMVKGWQKETSALVGRENVLWHELLLALRTGVPHATEVVGAGGQGERTFQARPGTLPAALVKEMQHRVGGRRGPLESYYAVQVLFPLLQIAGAGITPPAPLPKVPMPNHLFVRIAAGGTWAAVTQPHLAVVNRNDFWHWMVYNDRAIGDTPEFTRTVIQHELQHAADFENDLRGFEAIHPRPTSNPPAEFGRPAEESAVRAFGGEWGKYINDFIAFQETRTRPERHFEIILSQRREVALSGGPSWDRWSAAERAYWFQLIFNNLPPDVVGGQPLPGEDEVLAAFHSGGPELKLAAVARAYDAIHAALCPDKDVEPGEVAKKRANARTLVQHFDPIIEQALREGMQETPRAGVLDLLRRPPEHPHGMECQL